MTDLNTTKIGTFTKDSDTSTPAQITSYLMSALSADSVALGGGLPDINTKTKTKNKKQNSESVVIGKNANNTDTDAFSTSVVVVGSGATANNWGTAIGVGTKAYLGMAFGADAWAGPEEDKYKEAGKTYEDSPANAVAIGRYAKSTASGAIQLGGQREEIDGKLEYYGVNNDKNSLKFYVGGTDHKNITVVHSDGTISADNAYAATTAASCTGNSNTATTLQTTHTIGGQNFNGSQDVVLSASLADADAGTATDKLITPYATARAVKNALIHNANGTAGGTAIEGDATKAQVQSWLGTNQLTFVFNDSTTRTFNFVCNEVIS